MPTFDDFVELCKLSIDLQSNDTTWDNVIRVAAKAAWGRVAREHDWWFLCQDTPYAMSLTVGEIRYPVNVSNFGIGIVIETSADKEAYVYHNPHDFRRAKAGKLSVKSGVFTFKAIASGKKIIEIYPAPAEAVTASLVYVESGVESNFDKLPNEWYHVPLEAFKAMVAKPAKVPPEKWLAMAYRAEDLYRELVADMKAKEGEGLVSYYRPEIETSDDTAAELEDLDRI